MTYISISMIQRLDFQMNFLPFFKLKENFKKWQFLQIIYRLKMDPKLFLFIFLIEIKKFFTKYNKIKYTLQKPNSIFLRDFIKKKKEKRKKKDVSLKQHQSLKLNSISLDSTIYRGKAIKFWRHILIDHQYD